MKALSRGHKMIKVVYDGNLGNNLFQYAFGRILAERLGYSLDASPIPGFPRTSDRVPGKCYTNDPFVLRGQKPDLSWLQEDVDPQRQVVLTGYFQRTEYYHPYKEAIRSWFECDYSIEGNVGVGDVVIGVRRGTDYIPQHGLPTSYYIRALETVHSFDKVHICSDSPSDPFVRHLARRYDASIRPAGALDNMQFIRSFRKIIMSNSTFLWWAAYLSHADQIIFPRPANGFWSAADPISKKIALEVPEPRYAYVDAEPYRSEFAGEIARLTWAAAVARTKSAVRPLLFRERRACQTSQWRFTESDAE